MISDQARAAFDRLQGTAAGSDEQSGKAVQSGDTTQFSLKDNPNAKVGININDTTQPFTKQILNGIKTVETRESRSLDAYIGQTVGLVRTLKNGTAILVGYAKISGVKEYTSEAEFREDYAKHRIAKGSEFDWHEGVKKYGYELTEVRAEANPYAVTEKGIVARDVDRAVQKPTAKKTADAESYKKQNAIPFPKSKSVYSDKQISERTFSYEELIAKAPIQGHIIPFGERVKFNADGRVNEDYLISTILGKCEHIQTNSPIPTYYVGVKDINRNVEITKKAIDHGINRKEQLNEKGVIRPNVKRNAEVSIDIADILSNSIEVNHSSKWNNAFVPFSRIMLGVAGIEQEDGSVEYYAVRSIVEEREGQGAILTEYNILGKLYALNAKKIDSVHAQRATNAANLTTQSLFEYNINELLDDVKDGYNDTFSKDVYSHLGKAREVNELSKTLQFSEKDTPSIEDTLLSIYNRNTVDAKYSDSLIEMNRQQMLENLQKGRYASVVAAIAAQTELSENDVWNALAPYLLGADGIAKRDGLTYANVHELSISNLRKAIKLGGLAAPSIGIVDVDDPVTNFGEVSLILPYYLTSPERDPTFAGDAYSSSFAPVARFIDLTDFAERISEDYKGVLTDDELSSLQHQLSDYSIYDDENQRTAHSMRNVSYEDADSLAGDYGFSRISELSKLYKAAKADGQSYREFLKAFVGKYFTHQMLYRQNTQDKVFQYGSARHDYFREYDLDSAVEEQTAADNDFAISTGERINSWEQMDTPAYRAKLKAKASGYNYYEAKPQRAISIGDIAYAVVPGTTPADIVSSLEDEGVKVVSYEQDKTDSNRTSMREAIKGILESDTGNIRYQEKDDIRSDVEILSEAYEDSAVTEAQKTALNKFREQVQRSPEQPDTMPGSLTAVRQQKSLSVSAERDRFSFKTKEPDFRSTLFVLALTYLPGSLPSKYCRHR